MIKIVIIHWDEGIRIKLHFINSPFVVLFTSLLWSFDLIIEVQVKLHVVFENFPESLEQAKKIKCAAF